MTQTCRAAVFPGDGTVEIREFAVPGPPPGGAVLAVEAVGLCGSDAAQFHGVELVPGASAFPVVPGHETVGRVVELAPDADLGVAVGDRVGVDEILPGGPLRVYGYSDMTGAGEPGLWGGYGEYMQLFAGTRLHRLPSDGPAAALTVFEPLANAVNWVERVGVHPGETVVVQGPGHQGLAVVAAALAAGADRVVVTGTSSDGLRLRAAEAMGATATLMVDRDDVGQAVRDLTKGWGADVVFDVTTATATVPQAVELVRYGGRILLAGLKHFRPVPDLVTDHIVTKSLTLFGGSGFTPASMATAVEMLRDGTAHAETMAGVTVGLDEIPEAIALLERRDPDRDAVRVTLVHANR
ncbi:zinc-dependent alcohol dehydrogenase [Rhabdothermincola salaria]|uniref:zinc-dependent alcohol dehydrogenase n=1 Tax=Rhabdothermincola salaria TaxID=2903142 RepID=UPI001E3211F6|nr:zinc-binding dehydrogenase [Rhabdothermincola salaria]MCD9624674.1 zinc-binding dehydrogenase [Rhabdothermincola salaria]